MKIIFRTSIASATFSYRPKQIADIDDKLAQAWISLGIANEVIDEVPAVEAPATPIKKSRKVVA